MANISITTGTISIENLIQGKQNAQEIQKAFNDFCTNYQTTDGYGINIITIQHDSKVADFYGSGRWYFSEELMQLSLTDDKQNDKYLQILLALLDDEDIIDVEYVDYEPGAGFLTATEGSINKNGVYQQSTDDYLSYTDRNKIEYKVEEGLILDNDESIQKLTDSLQEDLPTINDEQIKMIIKTINTGAEFDGGITDSSYETFIDEIQTDIDDDPEKLKGFSPKEVTDYMTYGWKRRWSYML